MDKIPFLQKLLGKDKTEIKGNWLFFLGIAGIALIFLSGFWPAAKAEKKPEKTNQLSYETDYISTLEEKLISMLEQTQGVGKVKVMITLESTVAVIYAQDEQSDTQTENSSTQEQMLQKSVYKSEHVIIENSGEKAPLVETSLSPEIKGVAVVCTGGGDISVIKNVTELISALLALPTNRICVTKMI